MRKVIILLALISFMVLYTTPPAHADRVTASVPVGSHPDAMAYNPSDKEMYVANFYSNSVSVMSGRTVVANVAVAAYPQALAFDPSDNEMYVASDCPCANAVSVISGTTVVANVTTGYDPDALAFNPSNHDMYVANYFSFSVSVLSGTSLVANIMYVGSVDALAFNPSNNDMYAATLSQGNGQKSGIVTVISGTSLIADVDVGFVPTALVFNPSDNEMYVATRGFSGPSSVSVISGTSLASNVTIGHWIRALAFDPANNDVYVAVYGPSNGSEFDYGNVSIISGTNVVNILGVGSGPIAFAFNPSDHDLYLANQFSNTVSIISKSTLIANVPVGSGPYVLAFNPSNHDIYVANQGSNTVSMIEPGPSLPDFMLSASPDFTSGLAGTPVTSIMKVTGLKGFTGTVNLSITVSPPTGLNCSLSTVRTRLNFRVTTSTSILSCSGSAGYYNVTVTGISRDIIHSAIITMFVIPTSPDFLISPVSSVSFDSGSTGTSYILMSFWNGFYGPVGLSSTVSPSTGLSVSLSPQTIDCGSYCSSATSKATFSSTTPGSYMVTITGMGDSLTHSITVAVTVLKSST
jgi:YVTN family beta-propeller protein